MPFAIVLPLCAAQVNDFLLKLYSLMFLALCSKLPV